MPSLLEKTPSYFPLASGTYDVGAGLRSLGTDFGNGPADARVFQIAEDWPRFRENKLTCRGERLRKYVAQTGFDPATEQAVASWMAGRLAAEYPGEFIYDGRALRCVLTGDNLAVDGENAFDALCLQVSEDLCVIRSDGARDWLAAGHVCGPGHWAIEDKIGRPFVDVHAPVPGIEPINRHAGRFVEMMIGRGPFVRFAWGFGTDDRPNHHPLPPPGVDAAEWRGRRFDPANPRLFLRVERQVMWGLPAANAAVFTIRVSHLDGYDIRADPFQREKTITALQSMSPAALAYKGLTDSVSDVIAWLKGDGT